MFLKKRMILNEFIRGFFFIIIFSLSTISCKTISDGNSKGGDSDINALKLSTGDSSEDENYVNGGGPGSKFKNSSNPLKPSLGGKAWDGEQFKKKIDDAKKYFKTLPKIGSIPAGAGGVMQASETIDNSDTWVNKLGLKLKDKVALVNAGNKSDSLGGGGLMAGITGWLGTMRGQNKFSNLKSSDGILKTKNGLDSGDFSISDVQKTQWKHLNACGIDFRKSGDVGKNKKYPSLMDAFVAQKKLYTNLLEYAQMNNIPSIVVPALSSDIFASGGGENADGTIFTESQAKAAAFIAAKESIEEFKNNNLGSKLMIIVNNFGDVENVNL